jgi:hypothetical protein
MLRRGRANERMRRPTFGDVTSGRQQATFRKPDVDVRQQQTNRSRIRRAICGSLIVVGCLACTSQAFADSVTLSVTTTTGASDPAAHVPRLFTVSGTSAVSARVFIKYRAPGGAACAPSAETDSGTYLDGYDEYDDTDVNGAFSFTGAQTWPTPGAVVFCMWLADNSESVSTPFTQAITFRAPTGTITATFNPIAPTVNNAATITITGASEAPADVFATVRTAGGSGCAPTYGADSGDEVMDGDDVNGSFSLTATTTQSTPGNYLLCLWLAQSSTDPNPVAGPQPQPFTVTGPTPVVQRTRVAASSTLRRRGARYSGRISTSASCSGRRTVVLRRAGTGVKSFGRTLSRANGTYTISRSTRLRGTVYVIVTARSQGGTICSSTRSTQIRG